MEAPVLFSGVLCTKVVCCGNAYIEKRNKRMFIDDLPANIQIIVRVFLDLEQNENFLESAQYVNTLLRNTRLGPSTSLTQNQRSWFDRDQRARLVVDAEVKLQGRMPKNKEHFNQAERETVTLFKIGNLIMMTEISSNTLLSVSGPRPHDDVALYNGLIERARRIERSTLLRNNEYE